MLRTLSLMLGLAFIALGACKTTNSDLSQTGGAMALRECDRTANEPKPERLPRLQKSLAEIGYNNPSLEPAARATALGAATCAATRCPTGSTGLVGPELEKFGLIQENGTIVYQSPEAEARANAAQAELASAKELAASGASSVKEYINGTEALQAETLKGIAEGTTGSNLGGSLNSLANVNLKAALVAMAAGQMETANKFSNSAAALVAELSKVDPEKAPETANKLIKQLEAARESFTANTVNSRGGNQNLEALNSGIANAANTIEAAFPNTGIKLANTVSSNSSVNNLQVEANRVLFGLKTRNAATLGALNVQLKQLVEARGNTGSINALRPSINQALQAKIPEQAERARVTESFLRKAEIAGRIAARPAAIK